jgi:hypothetical protein
MHPSDRHSKAMLHLCICNLVRPLAPGLVEVDRQGCFRRRKPTAPEESLIESHMHLIVLTVRRPKAADARKVNRLFARDCAEANATVSSPALGDGLHRAPNSTHFLLQGLQPKQPSLDGSFEDFPHI